MRPTGAHQIRTDLQSYTYYLTVLSYYIVVICVDKPGMIVNTLTYREQYMWLDIRLNTLLPRRSVSCWRREINIMSL